MTTVTRWLLWATMVQTGLGGASAVKKQLGESLHRSLFQYSSFKWLFLMRLCILRWEFHPRYGWGPVGCERPFSTYAAPHRFGFLPMWAAATLASSPWVWSRKETGWAPVTRQHAREHRASRPPQWEPWPTPVVSITGRISTQLGEAAAASSEHPLPATLAASLRFGRKGATRFSLLGLYLGAAAPSLFPLLPGNG